MESLVTSPAWGVGSLLFFVLFFVGVLAWVYRPSSREHYEDCGKIPLQEDK